MVRRKIIKIDEEKCDGCGKCVDACVEGAIQIINGKARLVSESYCDGLGVCIGECPRGAITIEEREADEFNPEAVSRHLEEMKLASAQQKIDSQNGAFSLSPCLCPGVSVQEIQRNDTTQNASAHTKSKPLSSVSQLGNWPVQLRLVPVNAHYLDEARLLIAADCVAYAIADFHQRFLNGRRLLIGCPKLDDAGFYQQKLAEIFRNNNILSIDVVYMEVPCCYGLVRLVQTALLDSGKKIPVTFTKIGIRGEVIESISSEVPL